MNLPAPVPLDPPPGDPSALADLVSVVTGAAFGMGVLDAHLAGPATSAPGWLGADATAAAEQVVTVSDLVRRLHETLTAAEQRLRLHAQVLDDARTRIAALRRDQAEDFAVAWTRVGQSDPALAQPVIRELEEAETDRRRAHAAAVADVLDDATATAQVLDGATTGLGGTGAPGQEAAVLANVAVLLPGWGDGELIARAWAAARALDGPVTADDIDAIAREGLPFAGAATYAGALLADLDEDGVRWLLVHLGQATEPSGIVAQWLATAFGAASSLGAANGPLRDVLDARYIDPASTDGTADEVVFGLTALLAAVPATAGGVRNETAAAWGVQMLGRERQQGVTATDRLRRWGRDPVTVVVDRLAAAGDRDAAAVLLGGREAWDALLARSWDDDGAAFATLVRDAAAAGPAGEAAVRSGLQALGTGLSPTDVDVAWTVDRTTAAELSPALGDAVAAHPGVVTDALAAAGAGQQLSPTEDAALRGLGYLTLDVATAAIVQSAIDQVTGAEPLDLAGTDPTTPARAVAIRSAFVATREYAQRLDHAIDGYLAMSDAVDRQFSYDVSLRFPVFAFSKIAGLFPGTSGPASLVEALVQGGASLVNADGSWALAPDNGLVFDREDAAAAVAPLAPGADPATEELLARQARAAFDRTAQLLGHPEPPAPPDESVPDDPVDLKRTQLDHVPGHD
ncbi:hypothetical protein [Petropleomorpha daqingensis]|uniref:Uncharacterized protein n=1 Tax=Petropleomorpha daqingensis TaxID=2026353 RepID=A0A853CE39_9ACTN|nr:hypothetical protein [Petropleomorpha daqingensis]NYJ04842.1 hypothetical protein [Petropleomorpha daqingensis]